MATKARCEKCDREIANRPDEYRRKIYVQAGKVLCKDCLVEIGVIPDNADPTMTFAYTSNNVTRVV